MLFSIHNNLQVYATFEKQQNSRGLNDLCNFTVILASSWSFSSLLLSPCMRLILRSNCWSWKSCIKTRMKSTIMKESSFSFEQRLINKPACKWFLAAWVIPDQACEVCYSSSCWLHEIPKWSVSTRKFQIANLESVYHCQFIVSLFLQNIS